MAPRLKEPMLIAEWRRTSKERSTSQYASLARRFLEGEGVVDVTQVRKSDIERYILKIENTKMRPKTICALKAFFGYLLDRNVISEDPTRRLTHSVRNMRKSEALVDRLKKAGMREADARRVLWRDVAELAIRSVKPHSRMRLPPRETVVMRELVEYFFKRAASITAQELDALLESRID